MNKPSRLGIFGGSFNPVHNGHMQLAHGMIKSLNLDTLFLIPVLMPPHKTPSDFASPQQRMEMCKLAAEGDPNIEVSEIEISRSGKSFTVDTLHEIKKAYPTAKLFLIIGGDMFLSFETWRNVPEILRLATICAAPRDMETRMNMEGQAEKLRALGGKILLPSLPLWELSSTEIRTRIASGKPVTGMISEKVEQYIIENNLYLGFTE